MATPDAVWRVLLTNHSLGPQGHLLFSTCISFRYTTNHPSVITLFVLRTEIILPEKDTDRRRRFLGARYTLDDEFSLRQLSLVTFLPKRKDEASTPSSNAIFCTTDYFNYQMHSLSIWRLYHHFQFSAEVVHPRSTLPLGLLAGYT